MLLHTCFEIGTMRGVLEKKDKSKKKEKEKKTLSIGASVRDVGNVALKKKWCKKMVSRLSSSWILVVLGICIPIAGDRLRRARDDCEPSVR